MIISPGTLEFLYLFAIIAFCIAWPLVGIAYLMRWRFRQIEEVTMLDIVAILVVGFILGMIAPLPAFLYSIKIRPVKEPK